MDVEGNVSMKGSQLKADQEGENEQREAVMFVRTLQELSHSMEAIEEHRVQEDQSETSLANEKECMCNIFIVHCYILDSVYILCITCLLIANFIPFVNECLYIYSLTF